MSLLENNTKLLIDARVLTAQRGGVSRILLNMLSYLSERPDLEIRCIVMNGCREALPKYVNVEYIKLNWPLGIRRFMRVIVENTTLAFHVYKFNPDIVICPSYTVPLVFRIYKPFKLVSGIWDITYTTHPDHYKLYERLVLQRPSALAAHISDLIITCSKFDASQIVKYYNVSKDSIHVINLNADKEFFETHKKQNSEFSDYLKLKGISEPYYLTLGVIYQRRMIPEIIESFIQLKKDKVIASDMQLVVVGKNLIRPALDLKDIIDKAYNFGVRYIEFIPEIYLKEIFINAEVYICISEVDGEAILVKEAAALGTPVITTHMLGEGLNCNVEVVDSPVTVETISQSLLNFGNLNQFETLQQVRLAREHLTKIDVPGEYRSVLDKILMRPKNGKDK